MSKVSLETKLLPLWGLPLVSIDVINTMIKSNLGKKGLYILPHRSLVSSKEVKEET